MKHFLLYSGSSGVNNKLSAHRLPFDPETGIAGFEYAMNVLIDQTGEVVTRKGSSPVVLGSFHSCYPYKDGFLVIRDDTESSSLLLARVTETGSVVLHGIRSGLSHGAKMSYCMVTDRVYYMNDYNFGVTDGETSEPWPVSVFLRDTEAEIINTFAGKHLDILSGRFLISKNDEVFFTEPNQWGLIREATGRSRFESRVLMIASVQSGAFVSDENGIYFMSGADPNKWQARKVLDYPAVEYAVNPKLINPSFFGLKTTQLSVLFGTVNGPVIGLPDGSCYNLIDKNVTMPNDCGLTSGSIMVVDETLIIQSGE